MKTIKRGKRYKILNFDANGIRFVEGIATVKKIFKTDIFSPRVVCDVEFDDYPGEVYRRSVLPGSIVEEKK